MQLQNIIDCCQSVKEDDISLKKEMFKTRIEDNCSPLTPLNVMNSKFIFEASSIERYQYMVRFELVEKLVRINEELLKQNKTLYIKSCWRSYAQQALLMENAIVTLRSNNPDKTEAQLYAIASHFVSPSNLSTHSTGGAVDALIYDLDTGKILDFGVNDGSEIKLSIECYPNHPEISAEARSNRLLLIQLFEKEDFIVSLKEFWHFDYGNTAWAVTKKNDYAIYGPIFN